MASTTVVSGKWGGNGLFINGNFFEVKPNTDLTAMFSKMTI